MEVKVKGFYNDISPKEEWVLYKTPDDLEPGELHTGTLNAVHVATGQIVHILNTFIEEPSTFFLSDAMVAIPMDGIQLYNLAKKEFGPTPLVTYPKGYSLLQFSLNQDRNKVALLLLDWNSGIDHIKEGQRYTRVELQIIDLK